MPMAARFRRRIATGLLKRARRKTSRKLAESAKAGKIAREQDEEAKTLLESSQHTNEQAIRELFYGAANHSKQVSEANERLAHNLRTNAIVKRERARKLANFLVGKKRKS